MIALYVHPKNSNHLRSHLRAIMALDHSRLGLENKFLENKSGRIFCVRQVYFTKSCQQIWVRVKQPFIPFIQHTWGKTVLWGSVLSYRPRTECSISQFCNRNCTHSIFRTIEASSSSLKLKLTNVLSLLPGVCFFQRWTRGKKVAQSFLLQPEL